MNNHDQNSRLEAHPTQIIDRSRTVVFDFEGAHIHAYEGDTVASALYAAGITMFSRSFKYHRPRGLLCVAGRCPNCLMKIDGVPNVRACTTRVRKDIQVSHQNAWPSLDKDALSILDRLDRFLPVGFYYKTFHRPKLFWRLAQPILRRVAGLGSLEIDSGPDPSYSHRSLHTDVAVVGGGPAGMSAALAAARAGTRTTLIDDQPRLGGHLQHDTRTYSDVPGLDDAAGHELAAKLAESVGASESIEVLSSATAFGLYQDNLLGILSERHLVKLRARRVVVATGSYEVPLVFQRNDLPGVMLTTGAQRLVRLYGVVPGTTALVATGDDQGYYAALDLLDAGVRVAAVVDARPDYPRALDAAEALRSRGVLVLTSHVIARAEGKKGVTGATVARTGLDGMTPEQRRFDCDLICVSGGFQPASALLYQAGARPSFDSLLGETVPQEIPATIYAAGEVTGLRDLASNVLQGRLAGSEAAASLGETAPMPQLGLSDLRRRLSDAESSYRGGLSTPPPAIVPGTGKKRFVCYCEDVTDADIAYAIDEGFGDVQTLKRYTTVTMGPCQGKMCLKRFASICAQETGRTIDDTGITTQRPPLVPVPLGALAGPAHLPVKRTPIDRRHRELGAHMVDLGPWRRALSYGSPQEECIAVHERVGIIDVSTLGKLDVSGRDAPKLLDKVYTHRFSDLRVGRIRYGLMCTENGTIMDDGTVTRLADDRYFVTTTTGNVEAIEEWFKWWTAGTGMCAHTTNVTSAFAAINVAGPRARDTLSKLTNVDLSPAAFRYMRSARGDVGDVPTLLMKIGFVGESGWELHFPAEYGEYMWDVLMEAGSEFGIAPFGLEAQRILRLEKKHIIVGQDTDGVSNPLDSDMDWVVRFDKEDFIGRGGLVGIRERGIRNKLVGFVMRDGQVPDDGDPVMVGEAPVGRVTSARLSRTHGRGIGLAWVPVETAQEGGEIGIRVDGKILSADVTLQPFYDPEGKRLRE